MRSFILGIAILVAVPAYAVGQQRDRSERSATGRTAIPRAEAAEASRPSERRAEPRGTRMPPPRNGGPDDATPPRARRERRNGSSDTDTVRDRGRGDRRQPVAARPGRTWPTGVPRFPSAVDHRARAFPSFADPPHRWPVQGHGNYWPRYRRRQIGANVVFVPYVTPVVVEERTVVIEREVDNIVDSPVILEQPLPARLILDIEPPTAQVFADGYYIGIPEDFRSEHGGALLEPGPHRIDIFARDHEPVSFEINLTSGQSATFRRTLTPLVRTAQAAPNPAVSAPPMAKPPSTFYLIPGCYMGNVPPKEANLPATCDVARAIVRSLDP